AAPFRRLGGSACVHERAAIERLHRSPHGPGARAGVLRRVLTVGAPRVRLPLAARGLPVAWNLGGGPQPNRSAVEWAHADTRHGIRRVADARNATTGDRAWPPVRYAHLPLDSGPNAGRSRLSGRAASGGLDT